MKSTNIITRLLYLICSIGFLLFLGSLFSFIVLNFIGEEPTVLSIYWQRLFVDKMTYSMTIPGLILIAASVFFLIKKDSLFSKGWALTVMILLVLLIINTAFFIVPTVNTVNDLSQHQLNSSILLNEYSRLKTKEDIFGAINMLMTIGLLLMIIFRAKR